MQHISLNYSAIVTCRYGTLLSHRVSLECGTTAKSAVVKVNTRTGTSRGPTYLRYERSFHGQISIQVWYYIWSRISGVKLPHRF